MKLIARRTQDLLGTASALHPLGSYPLHATRPEAYNAEGILARGQCSRGLCVWRPLWT